MTRPDSRLMRVPLETYQQIADSARKDRRAMNQQLAVLIEEALANRRRAEANGAEPQRAAVGRR